MEKSFMMGLKKNKDGDKWEVNINVTIVIDPVKDLDLIIEYATGGSSARVALQGQLRSHTAKSIQAVVKSGVTTTLAEIKAGKWRVDAKPSELEVFKQTLLLMTREEAIAKVMETGQPEDRATRFVDRLRAEAVQKPVDNGLKDLLAAEIAGLDEEVEELEDAE